jgi:hypothetical protein
MRIKLDKKNLWNKTQMDEIETKKIQEALK